MRVTVERFHLEPEDMSPVQLVAEVRRLRAEVRRLRASRRPRAYLCNDGDNHRQPCDCARNATPEPPPDRSWLQ